MGSMSLSWMVKKTFVQASRKIWATGDADKAQHRQNFSFPIKFVICLRNESGYQPIRQGRLGGYLDEYVSQPDVTWQDSLNFVVVLSTTMKIKRHMGRSAALPCMRVLTHPNQDRGLPLKIVLWFSYDNKMRLSLMPERTSIMDAW